MSHSVLQKNNLQMLLGALLIVGIFAAFVYDRRSRPSPEAIRLASRGYELAEAGKNKEALHFASAALQHSANYAYAHRLRANIFYNQDKFPEAVVEYSNAIRLNPAVEDYFYRAMARYAGKLYKEALDDLLMAAKYRPRGKVTSFLIQHWVGRSYYQLDELESAEQAFRESIRLSSRYQADKEQLAESYSYLGSIAFKKERYHTAVKNYTRLIEIQPHKAWTYLSRAKVYFAQEKFEEAIQDLNDALYIEPEYNEAIYFRARSFQLLGEIEKAETDLNRLVRSNLYKESNYAARGCFYVTQNRHEEAKSDFAQAWKGEPQVRQVVRQWVAERANAHGPGDLARRVLPE